MENNIAICEKEEDEKIRKVYNLLLKRSCDKKNIKYETYDMSSSEPESEKEEKADVFQVDQYIYGVQDRINDILHRKKHQIFLKILLSENKFVKLNVNQITFDFCSNCCVLAKIVFNYVQLPNRRKLSKCDMILSHYNEQTDKLHKILKISHKKEDKLDATEMAILLKTEKKETVVFTLSSEIDLTDASLILKFNYLDYDLKK